MTKFTTIKMNKEQKCKYDDSIWDTWSIDTIRTEQKIKQNKNKEKKEKTK
jgi:hypothetical protein